MVPANRSSEKGDRAMDVGVSALTQKQAISNCRAPGEAVVTNAARKCRDELQRRGKELQKGKENALRYEIHYERDQEKSADEEASQEGARIRSNLLGTNREGG